MTDRPIVLVICDGWGVRAEREGNAIALAQTPVYDRLLGEWPNTTLLAHGEEVGLPDEQMGNSEVGHLNIGAGRVVPQDILRIDRAIGDGSFYENPTFRDAVAGALERGGSLHLTGLLSDGGVHSHERHLWALLTLARRTGLQRVFIHAFLDGRDTPPQSALAYLARLEEKIAEVGLGRVATLSGRYYAMDRDKRWERVKKAWEAMVHGEGRTAASAREAVDQAYASGETDEFVTPTVIGRRGPESRVSGPESSDGRIWDGDSVVFFNFRADRARQLAQALGDPEFREFDRGTDWPRIRIVTMTHYKKEFPYPVAFPPLVLARILAEELGRAGLRNLRIAETEKYAHVTYFFNGGVENEYPGEERVLIPSLKVPTYDTHPQMRAPEITERACAEIASRRYDLVVMNYANADMVGHTGRLEPTIAAIETLDACFGKLLAAVESAGGTPLITGDHGNAEQMIDPKTGEPHTAHTENPVPFILADGNFRGPLRSGGALRDIAPTILELLGLPAPAEMEGRDLRLPAEESRLATE